MQAAAKKAESGGHRTRTLPPIDSRRIIRLSCDTFQAPSGSDVLSAALTYARLGFAVLPLWHPEDCAGGLCGDARCKTDPFRRGKHPWRGHGLRSASREKAQLSEWFGDERRNVGLVPGPGRLVLDIDPRNGGSLDALGKLPATPLAFSGASGWHAIFSYDGDDLSAANLPGVDLKSGESGYVVAAPSLHGLGGRYEWIVAPWHTECAPLPRHLIDGMRVVPAKSKRSPTHKTPMPAKAAELPTRSVPKTAERRANGDASGLRDQSRSGLLLSLAATLALGGWSGEEAELYAWKSDLLASKLAEESRDYFARAIWPKAQLAHRRVEAGWAALETEDWSGRAGIRDRHAFAFCLSRFENSWPEATISYREVAKALGAASAKTGGHALRSLEARGLLGIGTRGNAISASTYFLTCTKEAKGTPTTTLTCIDRCGRYFLLPAQDAFLSTREGNGPGLTAHSGAIYQAILERELTATEIAEAIGCHVKTARKHLGRLRQYGLAEPTKHRRWLGVAEDLESVAGARGTAGLGERRRKRLAAQQVAQKQFVDDRKPAGADATTGEILTTEGD